MARRYFLSAAMHGGRHSTNAMAPPRGRYWCFTLNNPTTLEVRDLENAVDLSPDVTYVTFGRETGDSGTPHLQGYLELASKLRLGGVRKLPGLGRSHLELRAGSQEEAVAYCHKDDPAPFVSGTLVPSTQGKRNDLAEVKSDLDSGKTQLEVAEAHFGSWCRYRKSFCAYQSLRNKRLARDVRVVVLYGPAGVGKTRLIFEHEPELFICPTDSLQWSTRYPRGRLQRNSRPLLLTSVLGPIPPSTSSEGRFCCCPIHPHLHYVQY